VPAENTEKRIQERDMINELLDTVMNIEVFLFIGLLVWLYFKQVDNE
jgi:hypothetical protein